MLSLFPCLFCIYLFIFNIECFTYFFMGVYILKYKWQNLLLLLFIYFFVEDVELYLIIVRKTKKYKYTALFGVGVQLYHIIVSQPCTQLRFPYSILYMNFHEQNTTFILTSAISNLQYQIYIPPRPPAPPMLITWAMFCT